MQAVTKVVKILMRYFPPDKIAVVFNGWFGGGNRFVLVFATYFATNNSGFFEHLFCLSSIAFKDTFNAKISTLGLSRYLWIMKGH